MADYGGSSGGSNTPSNPRLHRCKYCSKEYDKHQALGGHQGAHKLQRLEAAAANNTAIAPATNNTATAPATAITTTAVSLILQLSTPSNPRLHRCKYCSKEYDKHQALGGHQGAHKRQRLEAAAAANNTATAPATATEIPVFEIDLNNPPRD